MFVNNIDLLIDICFSLTMHAACHGKLLVHRLL